MLEGFPIDFKLVPKNIIKFWRIDCNDTLKYTVIVGEWCGRRPYMEDRVLDFSEQNIYGIFDGHGGADIANYFSSNFKSNFESIYKKSNLDIKNNHDVENTSIEYSNILYDTLNTLEDKAKCMKLKSGSTGQIVKIYKDYLISCSVGDSESRLIDSSGKIHSLSSPHSFSRFDEYSRYVTESHKNNNYIRKSNVIRTSTGMMPTRTLGDFKHKYMDSSLISDPEVRIIYLPNKKVDWEIIVIGSDGIFDCLNMRMISDEMIRSKILIKQDEKTVYDFSKIKVNILMQRLQQITSKVPDIYNKLQNIYGGDNCSICIITKNDLNNKWDPDSSDPDSSDPDSLDSNYIE
jgi:serine/threonine protein phosphatase PrpC